MPAPPRVVHTTPPESVVVLPMVAFQEGSEPDEVPAVVTSNKIPRNAVVLVLITLSPSALAPVDQFAVGRERRKKLAISVSPRNFAPYHRSIQTSPNCRLSQTSQYRSMSRFSGCRTPSMQWPSCRAISYSSRRSSRRRSQPAQSAPRPTLCLHRLSAAPNNNRSCRTAGCPTKDHRLCRAFVIAVRPCPRLAPPRPTRPDKVPCHALNQRHDRAQP